MGNRLRGGDDDLASKSIRDQRSLGRMYVMYRWVIMGSDMGRAMVMGKGYGYGERGWVGLVGWSIWDKREKFFL